MLVSSEKMLKNAKKNGYAVPAINTQGGNYDIIWSICKAAQEMSSPIILAHYASTGAYSGHDWFYTVAKWCANKVDVPVAIHLDHGDSFDICMEALKIGFTSIMIDASSQSIEENARISSEVIRVAHAFNVPVETEIGELLRLDSKDVKQVPSNTADPETVRKYLELCSPDSLAIGIGNAHGYYAEKPDIRLDVLQAVSEFSDIPLVLHGCTGMDDAVIDKAISYGIAKINFGTQIRYQYLEHFKNSLDNLDHQGHSWKISAHIAELLSQDVKEIIRVSKSEKRV